jgi:arylsulfatase A-like enzyme
MSTNRPNILFVVVDSLRYDSAEQFAPNLCSLADGNVSFERAIAPASWSLPSHASLFTGEYPYEHGVCQLHDQMRDVPLVKQLGRDGYTAYGVSANGFAGPRMAIDRAFDEFRFTGGDEPFVAGLDVYSLVYRLLEEEISKPQLAWDLLSSALSHEHTTQSLINLATALTSRAASNVPPLQQIPHPLFTPRKGYSYTPKRNTHAIRSFVDEEERPFFIFANYMDTHTPYTPPNRHLERATEDTVSRSERIRLNEEVALPWAFVEQIENGTLNEADVELVRRLYEGEVSSVDDHVGKLVKFLKRKRLFEETLVIVTADHGQNLGEKDELGRRRMGHEGSMSDFLLRVPLVVANSHLDDQTISEPVSIRRLYELVLAAAGGELTTESVVESLTTDGPVLSQYPALGGESFHKTHPGVPDELADQRVVHDTTVAYDEDWKVGVRSDGTEWGMRDGAYRDHSEAPVDLRTTCREAQAQLRTTSGSDDSLSERDRSQLEALGYL